ncbi:MAG: AsmA family protein [Candidatus Brocadiaceae bacterium]
MKKAIIIGLGVVFSLLIAAVVLPFVIDVNKYKGTVKEQAKPYLPRDFDFSRMDLTILKGFGVEMKGLRIGENPAFGKGDFLDLGRLDVKVKLLPLLKGQFEVKKVILNKPEIRIQRNKQGEFNYSDLVGSTQSEKPDGDKTQQKKKSGNGSMLAGLLVSELAIRQGTISFIDEFRQPSPVTTTIDLLDFELKDVSFDKPIHMSIATRLPGGKDQNFKMKGNLGPLGETMDFNKVFMDIALSLKDFSIDKFKSFLPENMLSYSAGSVVNMDVRLKGSRASGISSEGEIQMEKSAEATEKKKHAAAMRLSLKEKMNIALGRGNVDIEQLDLNLKETKVSMKGKVEDFNSKPQWDLTFQSQSLNPDDIIAFYPSAMPEGMRVSGLIDFEMVSKGNLDELQADGTLKTQNLKIFQSGTSTGFVKGLSMDFKGQKKQGMMAGNGKIEIKEGDMQSVAFEEMNSQFDYQNDHLKIQSFQTRAFQGEVSMTGDVETKNLQWTMKPILKNIDMEKVVDAFTRYKGLFDGKFSGSFTASGTGFGNLAESANANGAFKIDNGKLKNFNLVDTVLESLFDYKGVSQYLTSSKGELSKQKLTRFDALDCKFNKARNMVNITDMALKSIHTAKDTAADAFFNGSIDMKSQGLDLKGKIVLPPKYSGELVKKAEPFQALLDADKRMALPLSIGGSLSSPRPMLDSSYVATAMAKYYGGKELEKGLEKLGKEIGLPKDALKDKKSIEQPVENLIKDLFGDDSGEKRKKKGDKP